MMKIAAAIALCLSSVGALTPDEAVKARDSKASENSIQLDITNICQGPVNLYWLHNNRQSEEFMSTIPADHMFSQMTAVDQVFRVKWADGSNRGIFGEDILEQYIIEDLGVAKQEISVCLAARKRELLAEEEATATATATTTATATVTKE